MPEEGTPSLMICRPLDETARMVNGHGPAPLVTVTSTSQKAHVPSMSDGVSTTTSSPVLAGLDRAVCSADAPHVAVAVAGLPDGHCAVSEMVMVDAALGARTTYRATPPVGDAISPFCGTPSTRRIGAAPPPATPTIENTVAPSAWTVTWMVHAPDGGQPARAGSEGPRRRCW